MKFTTQKRGHAATGWHAGGILNGIDDWTPLPTQVESYVWDIRPGLKSSWRFPIEASDGTTGCYIVLARGSQPSDASPPVGVADSVTMLRSVLGMNVSDTARILDVERPTIYAWLSGRADPQPHNRARLAELVSVLEEYRGRKMPAKDALRAPWGDGKSVVDLLAERFVPTVEVHRRLHQLLDQQRSAGEPGQGLPESRTRRLSKARGIPMVEQRDEIDRITGRRIGPERD